MFTREQVVEASAEAGLAALSQREFRFYSADFVAPVLTSCLTVALFSPVASDRLARLWSAACFCHSENVCENWSVFRERFKTEFQAQKITAAEFQAASGELVDALNPELVAAIAEIRGVGSKVRDGLSIVGGAGLRSLIGISSDRAVVLVWTKAQNA